MGIKISQKIPVVCDGYVKYEAAEVDILVVIFENEEAADRVRRIQ